MTDITSILKRIRDVAEQGREVAQGNQCDDDDDDPYRELRENFEAILHNVNRLEAAMTTDTDTTDAAQWWWVEHDRIGWNDKRALFDNPRVVADGSGDSWSHFACVQCPPNATEHDIYQAAVDAWAEAGFSHAPKQPPGPKSVEEIRWRVIAKSDPLSGFPQVYNQFTTQAAAEYHIANDIAISDRSSYRIVRVNATVSEVDDDE